MYFSILILESTLGNKKYKINYRSMISVGFVFTKVDACTLMIDFLQL